MQVLRFQAIWPIALPLLFSLGTISQSQAVAAESPDASDPATEIATVAPAQPTTEPLSRDRLPDQLPTAVDHQSSHPLPANVTTTTTNQPITNAPTNSQTTESPTPVEPTPMRVKDLGKDLTVASALLADQNRGADQSTAASGWIAQADPTPTATARPATANLGTQQRWTFAAGVVFLNRNIPNVTTSLNVLDGSAFGTGNLTFNQAAGTQFAVGYHFNPVQSLQLTFLGLHEWRNSAAVDSKFGGEEIHAAFIPQPVAILDLPDIADDYVMALRQTIDYQTNLQNLELNYQHQLTPATQRSYVTLLGGLRYVGIDESFTLTSFDNNSRLGGNVGRYSIKTDNNLIGLQVGLNTGVQVTRRFGLGLKARAGLLASSAKQTSTFINDGASLLTINGSGSGTEIAPMLDLAGMATVDFSPNVSLNFGYRFLLVDGVATAPAQFASSFDFRTSLNSLKRETVTYNGPFVGVEVRF